MCCHDLPTATLWSATTMVTSTVTTEGWVSGVYTSYGRPAAAIQPPTVVNQPQAMLTATPTATSIETLVESTTSIPSITEWRGEYYANIDWTGSPVLVRDDLIVDFNWGKGSPDGSIPSDNYSVRWTRAIYFDTGRLCFHVRFDTDDAGNYSMSFTMPATMPDSTLIPADSIAIVVANDDGSLQATTTFDYHG